VVQGQLKKGNTPASVNRYLALIRNLLKMARDELFGGLGNDIFFFSKGGGGVSSLALPTVSIRFR